VYEDTELISSSALNPLASAADAGREALLGVYEDTEFVGAKVAAAAAGSSGSRRTMAAMPGGSSGGGSEGLCLYEDTEFITRTVGGPAGGSGRPSMGGGGSSALGLYEDTDFITRPVGGGCGASSSGGGHSMAAAAAGTTGGSGSSGLGLYEDTEFITAGAAAMSHDDSSGGGLGIYEDTEFITRPVAAAGASSSTSAGGGSGNALLLSKLNRLSLANEALSRGQARQGLQRSRDGLEDGQGASSAAGTNLGVYEDTEFIGGLQDSCSSGRGGALDVYADTEFLAKPVSFAAGQAEAASSSQPPQQQEHSRSVLGGCSDENSSTGLLRVKENVPTANSSSWQQQGRARSMGVPLAATGDGSLGAWPAAASGSSSGGGSILQPHQHAYGAAGPSRFGPGSAPNSPGKSKMHCTKQTGLRVRSRGTLLAVSHIMTSMWVAFAVGNSI